MPPEVARRHGCVIRQKVIVIAGEAKQSGIGKTQRIASEQPLLAVTSVSGSMK
jgi:hypothetical protein